MIYIRYLGGSAYDLPEWLTPIAMIALSVPMLIVCTLAGLAALWFTLRGMLADRDA